MKLVAIAWLALPVLGPHACAQGAAASGPSGPSGARATPLFDGKTLAGWVTKGGRYDGNAVWTVEDAAIVGRESDQGEGGLLYTERQYRNFVFRCEVKVEWPFDSGIFVRMAPAKKGAQVTIDARDGGEIGGIYADGWLLHNPKGIELFDAGGWNAFEVECVGEDQRIRATLNGKPLVEHRLPKTGDEHAPTGLIGLQVHGGGAKGKRARFRALSLVELPDHDPELFAADGAGRLVPTAKGRAEGWQPLFDGVSLAGWKAVGGDGGFAVRDGAIVLSDDGSAQYLRTERADFRDFVLRLEFAIPRGANSGVFLRAAPDGGDPAYSGCEVQVLDDFFWEQDTGTRLKDWQRCGSLYAAQPPSTRTALRPLGEWNSYEIRYRGSRIRTLLNGQLLYDVDTDALATDRPFRDRAPRGFLGLQRHAPAKGSAGHAVRFRNVLLKEL